MTALLEQLGIRNRASAEAFVRALIDMLDTLDGDADDEPYLADFRGSNDDREEEETDLNGDEGDFDRGEDDSPGYISGGGERDIAPARAL